MFKRCVYKPIELASPLPSNRPGSLLTMSPFFCYSGLARTFGRAAYARPTPLARRAFEPLRSNALPALSARFASTDAGLVGKIHQVIGAVVDGTYTSLAFLGGLALGSRTVGKSFSAPNSIANRFTKPPKLQESLLLIRGCSKIRVRITSSHSQRP